MAQLAAQDGCDGGGDCAGGAECSSVCGQDAAVQTTAGAQSGQQDNYVFKANAELVLTNVVVRDAKTGELVRGLNQNDFTVSENGKRQQISTFDFQSVEMATPLNEATVSGLAAGVNGPERRRLSWRGPRICGITG